MNPLARHLDRTGLSVSQFAKRHGFNVVTVHGWARGSRNPSLGAAFRLERVTDGEIPAAAWVKPNRSKRV